MISLEYSLISEVTIVSFYRLSAEEEKYNNKKAEAEAQLAEYD